MRTYRVEIEPPALKQLSKFDHQVRERIRSTIRALAADPRPHGYRKLTGRPGFRIRVGDWRVIYTIQDNLLLVLVLEVDHRSKIYDR